MAEQALADAERAEKEIAAGRYRGPLHGIPVSRQGPRRRRRRRRRRRVRRVPPRHPQHDAPVVANLRAAGAIIVGKTNLHEFAFGTTSDETAFGAVRNPLDPSRSPGGSSGGAAVALVEGMCFGSVGTDTGGSIRIPAAACGITGLKPTFGEISCDGSCRSARRSITSGRMARTVADAALLYHGDARRRRVSVDRPADGRRRSPCGSACRRPTFSTSSTSDVRRLFGGPARGSRAGRTQRFSDVAIAHAERTPDVYLHIVAAGSVVVSRAAARAHAEQVFARRAAAAGDGTATCWRKTTLRAMHARTVLRRAVDRALEGLDALLLPALPIGAPPLGAATVDDRRRNGAGARDDAAPDAALQHHRPSRRSRCRAAGEATDCRAASSSSGIAAAPSGCSRSPPGSSVRLAAAPDRSGVASGECPDARQPAAFPADSVDSHRWEYSRRLAASGHPVPAAVQSCCRLCNSRAVRGAGVRPQFSTFSGKLGSDPNAPIPLDFFSRFGDNRSHPGHTEMFKSVTTAPCELDSNAADLGVISVPESSPAQAAIYVQG